MRIYIGAQGEGGSRPLKIVVHRSIVFRNSNFLALHYVNKRVAEK